MDLDRFSAIAHRDHRYLEPVGGATMEAVYDRMRLRPGARVVDLGCGKAEALIRLIERYDVRGIGIDRNPRFIAAARDRAAGSVGAEALELRTCDIADLHAAPASFDAALCLGSTSMYPSLRRAVRAAADLVKPGGAAVIGVGFWRAPPAPAYLALLGVAEDALGSHADNERVCGERGVELIASFTASDEERDTYEEMYRAGVERYARERPHAPEVPELLARIRGWHDGYRRWGRDTLGFGVYLMRRPA